MVEEKGRPRRDLATGGAGESKECERELDAKMKTVASANLGGIREEHDCGYRGCSSG